MRRRRAAAAARLDEALSQLSDTDGDFAANLEADLGFHLLLCQLSGNTMLVEAWRYLEGRIRVTIMNCEERSAPAMMSRDRHAPIVEAIAHGDVAAATEVAMEAVQLHGGNGYMAEFHVEQLARDAKVLQIYAGTDEIQITHIAKDLLRR